VNIVSSCLRTIIIIIIIMAKAQRKRKNAGSSSSSKYDTGTSTTGFAGIVVLGIPMTFWLAVVVLAVATSFVGRLSSSNAVHAGQGIERLTRSTRSASPEDPLATTQLFDEATSLKASLELDAWELIDQHKAPWLPAAHIILANYVSEHGDQRCRDGEWFQLLRQGMRLHHAIPAAEKGKTAEDLCIVRRILAF
jgi:hypothetical protein